MTEEQIKRETDYHLAKAVFLRLLSLGILSKDEVRVALRKAAKEFNPVWSGLPDIISQQLS